MNKLVARLHPLDALAQRCHDNARDKGFWPPEGVRNKGEMMMLEVSEIAERLEAIRHSNPPSEHIPAFTAEEEECADLLIRLMDYTAGYNLRLGEAFEAKVLYNSERPHKHNKQF